MSKHDSVPTGQRSEPGAVQAVPGSFSTGQLLELVWEGLEAGMIIYDRDGGRLLANAPARRLIADLDESTAVRVIYLADGESICPEPAWPMRRALRGETVRNEEFVLAGAPGQPGRRVVVSAFPIVLPDRTPGAMVSVFELNPAWKDQQANRTTLEQLGMMLSGATGYAIVLLDAHGLVSNWSISAERLLGYLESDIIGRPFSVFFLPEDRANRVPEAVLERARSTGGAASEGGRVRADGSRFWAYGVLTAIRDRQGEVTSFVGVVHDVTARYEAERAVEELNIRLLALNEELEGRVAERTALLEGRTVELISANAELEAFSYSVSHDLRAPVRAVQGFARIVRERYRELLPPEGQSYLGRIEEGAQRMGELVDALLRLARMQRQPMAAELVDMTELAGRARQALADHYPGGDSAISIEALLPVRGDPQLLQQVWINVMDNAVKYSRARERARVEVSSRREGDDIVYQVQDNGAGFDQRYADKLFQAFQRLHRAEEFAGIGIGLAIVHRVVMRHGGRVWAKGEVGVGATFCFALKGPGE